MAFVYVGLNDLNQFLSNQKLELTSDDLELDHNEQLELTAKNIIFGKFKNVYDVTTWVGTSTTPAIVKSIMGMWIAGRIYMRQYADTATDEANYGRMLVNEALALVDSILDGSIEADLTLIDADARLSETYDYIDPAFTMGSVF